MRTAIPSFRLSDNSVQLCSPFWVGISTIYIVKMFEIVFFFIVKDKHIFPCLHTIRISYNI